MQPNFRRMLSLIPAGLAAECIVDSGDAIEVTARAEARVVRCPFCGSPSRRIHSRYVRKVSDLPCSGRVRIRVVVRRLRCEAKNCRRRIFAERFDDAVLPAMARRTTRLECIVHHLRLALGGRPAATFARRLMLLVINDTLLRVVRRRARMRTEPLAVVGIDDWAYRRNHRTERSLALERQRIVALLPDREIATVQALAAAPGASDPFGQETQRKSRPLVTTSDSMSSSAHQTHSLTHFRPSRLPQAQRA